MLMTSSPACRPLFFDQFPHVVQHLARRLIASRARVKGAWKVVKKSMKYPTNPSADPSFPGDAQDLADHQGRKAVRHTAHEVNSRRR